MLENRILEIAFAFAESKEQAHFLNTIARSLKQGCRNGILDMQLCRIADHINEDGRWLIFEIQKFLEEAKK